MLTQTLDRVHLVRSHVIVHMHSISGPFHSIIVFYCLTKPNRVTSAQCEYWICKGTIQKIRSGRIPSCNSSVVGFTDASGVFAALGVVDAGESYFNVSLYNTSIPDAEFAEAASRSSEVEKTRLRHDRRIRRERRRHCL